MFDRWPFNRKPSAVVAEAEHIVITGLAAHEYATDSIELAVYLKCQGYHTIRVEPISQYRCAFVFRETPPQAVFVDYARQAGFIGRTITSYRGLVRDARAATNSGRAVIWRSAPRYSAEHGNES